MAGSSNVTGQESILFADNMSFDGTQRGGAMTTDGQLWIGSTAAPHVKLGQLIAGPGVTVTPGSGVITISSSQDFFVYRSPVIDFTTIAITQIVITQATGIFVPTQYSMVCVTENAPNSDSDFSVGYNAPDYDNFLANVNFPLISADAFLSSTNFQGPRIAAPASSSIRVNVTVPDSGVALTGYVVLLGYYI